jgi:hypothetical protein
VLVLVGRVDAAGGLEQAPSDVERDVEQAYALGREGLEHAQAHGDVVG